MPDMSDYSRAESEAAWARPTVSSHTAGIEAAAMGAFAIAGYAFASSLSIPWFVSAAVGLAAAFAVGHFDTQRKWDRYWKVYNLALQRKVDDA